MACILCGTKDFETIKDGVRDSNACRVISCKGCGFTKLEATSDDFEPYDLINSIPFGEYTDKTTIEDYRQRYHYDTLMQKDFLSYYISANSAILEVGCGHGFLVEALEKDGYHIEGMEINKSRIDVARTICTRTIHDYNLLEGEAPDDIIGKYDIVCGFGFFNFIDDPILYLNRLKKLIKPGGRLIISVPNINDHMIAKCDAYRDFYFQKCCLYIYNADTITKMLQKQQFENIQIFGKHRYSFVNALNWFETGKPQIDSPTYHTKNGLDWLDALYKSELEKNLTSDTLFVTCQTNYTRRPNIEVL